MKIKRFVSLLLVIVMLATGLVACADKPDDKKGNDNPGGDETGSSYENGPDLPDQKWDRDFNVLGKGKTMPHWQSRDLTADELGSDPISNAVYYRNSAIQERYGITVKEFEVSDYYDQAKEALLACQMGAEDYDMFCLKPEAVISTLINNGYLMDLKDMRYMDLSAPWYDQNSIEQLSLAHHVYLVTGSMLIMDDDATAGIFFNKKTQKEDTRIPDLYKLVDDGEWTIDKMTEIAGYAALDDNGDDVLTVGPDRWGLLSERSVTLALVAGGDLRIIDKDKKDDLPYIAATSENYLNMLEKVLEISNNFNVTMFAEAVAGQVAGDVWINGLDVAFNTNKALFYAAWLNRATVFRDMETDFGILPYPKYSEDQKDYCSFVSLYCANSISVPNTTTNPDFISFAIEALSAESLLGKNSLTEAYYEKTLGSKNIRDPESKRMLDKIFANTLFDLGYMFNWGNVCSSIMDLSGVSGGDASSFSRKMNALQKSINSAMNKTIEALNQQE